MEQYFAGIGGDDSHWHGGENPTGNTSGNITINGGIITVDGGYTAAGIGGGFWGSGGTTTINGGTVTATGGTDPTGMWAGGAGIGYGHGIRPEANITLDWTKGNLVIKSSEYGGTVSVAANETIICHEPGEILTLSGTLTDDQKAAIAGKTLMLSTEMNEITSGSTSWTSGHYFVSQDVSIDSRITVSGTVHLILVDGKTLTAPKGINVAEGNSLTIYGQTNNTGTLMINNVDSAYAGIGGGNEGKAGTITINGGTVTVAGGNNGAGGTIVINGGTVTATGFNSGAGIGGGYGGAGGTITLGWTAKTDSIYASSYSGTVTANKPFLIDGTDTVISGDVSDLSAINGKTLKPDAYAITVSGGNVKAPQAATQGETVTLIYTVDIPTGYKVVYSVNGEDIEGNTFTMPSEDVTITARLVPITYTITYNLNGGTADNPASYTVEDSFTLNNPAKAGCNFAG